MDRADTRKYHFIYKTTCKASGKWYIGRHSTSDLNDGYIGSGTRLWHSVNKHGKENHVCQILEFCPDRKSLANREAELVNTETLKDVQCLNLVEGGGDDWSSVNRKLTFEQRSAIGKAGGQGIARKMQDPIFKQKFSETVSKAQKMAYAEGKISGGFTNSEIQRELSLRAQSTEAKEKRKKTRFERQFQQGENNSQFGTRWACVCKENEKYKKIPLNQLEQYITEGWQRGRVFKKEMAF